MFQRKKQILIIIFYAITVIGLTAPVSTIQTSAASKYSISYYLYGGKNNTSNPSSYTTKDVKLKNPTKKGYTFSGWYTEPTYEHKISTIKATNKNNYKLYAKWEIVFPVSSDIKIPTLKTEGTWPCSNSKLQTAWKTYYPYFAQLMGEAAYKDRVLTWEWDSSIYNDSVEYLAETNTVYMGPVQHIADGIAKKDYMNLYFQMMHESGHLFYQYDEKPVNIGCGQWLFEALPLSSEAITKSQLKLADWDQNYVNYDIVAYMGDNCINGVFSDGNKFERTLTDSNASGSIQMLIKTMSYDTGFDYLARVNKIMFDYLKTSDGTNTISKELYGKFLDQAADGKTIDGKTPSEWLFSQPVANTAGDVGSFICCQPVEPVIEPTKPQRIRFYAFDRFVDSNGDLRESMPNQQSVTFKIYNQKNKCVQTVNTTTKGSETEIELKALPKGLYKIKMTSQVNGKTISNYNYFLVYAASNKHFNVVKDDNRMFILPVDKETQTIQPFTKDNYSIKGATSYQLVSGALLITAAPGAQVKITVNGKTQTVTKPEEIRIVPLDVK